MCDEALIVQVQLDALAVVHRLVRNWADNYLTWGKPEWPFTTQVFNKNCRKSFYRSQDGSVNDNWSSETWFKVMLLPGEILITPVISFVNLHSELFLLDLVFVLSVLFLNFSGILTLELEVEPNWKLEINLNRSTIV